MTAPTLTDVLNQSPDVVYRDLDADEGGVLLHMQTGGYFSVNPVGRDVWNLIDGRRTLADVVAALREQHPDATDAAQDDVLAFAAAITERGLGTVR